MSSALPPRPTARTHCAGTSVERGPRRDRGLYAACGGSRTAVRLLPRGKKARASAAGEVTGIPRDAFRRRLLTRACHGLPTPRRSHAGTGLTKAVFRVTGMTGRQVQLTAVRCGEPSWTGPARYCDRSRRGRRGTRPRHECDRREARRLATNGTGYDGRHAQHRRPLHAEAGAPCPSRASPP